MIALFFVEPECVKIAIDFVIARLKIQTSYLNSKLIQTPNSI